MTQVLKVDDKMEQAPRAPEGGPGKVRLARVAWQSAVFCAYLLILDQALFHLPVTPKVESQNPYAAKIEAYRALPSTPDVLFMGSSRIWMGVIPSEMAARLESRGIKITSYNLGAPATTPLVHYLFLRDLVLPKGKPGLIVLETAARELNGRNGRDDTPLRYLTRKSDVPDFLPKVGTFGEARELLFSNIFVSSRRFSDIRAAIAGEKPEVVLPGGDEAVKCYHDDGWLEYTYSPPMTWEEKREYWRKTYAEEVLLNYAIDGLPEYCLRKFLDLAKANGIPVVFLNIPVTEDQMTFFQHGEYDKYLAYIAERSAEYSVPFYDYNTPERRLGVEMFHDTHHLNAAGAHAFTAIVADEVVAPFFSRSRSTAASLPRD